MKRLRRKLWKSIQSHSFIMWTVEACISRNASTPSPSVLHTLTDVPVLFPIREQDIFKIGRDPRSNTFSVDDDPDFMVSRNHCEVYVVVYEPTINHVYVRDRKSYNGTYVNGVLVGAGPKISPGYLLQHGDVIEIRPYWKFIFVQEHGPPRRDLTRLQLEECKLFSNKYTLTDRCLGQGAEAVVYLATERATRKQLVCKLVNLDRVQSKGIHGTVQSKLQETDILRQLRHPNILPYIDAIISPHSLYTFTELASGGDLMSYLNRHDAIKEFDARIITRQIARGLRYLHGKGIVHRDLKPENVLLAFSPRLAYHRVMLSDFGNSAVFQRNRMLTNVGTTCYQAPEFQSGAQAHTSAVDIWSLGVVVLLLIASATDTKFQGINRMTQAEVGRYLKDTFSRLPLQPSARAKTFIWTCLQIVPSNRMDAIDAQCHDWLCTPESHLEFFKILDRRMMDSWNNHMELKPIPWEIPSLKKVSPVPEADIEPRSSHYFMTTSQSQARLALALIEQQQSSQVEQTPIGKDNAEEPPITPALDGQPRPEVDHGSMTIKEESNVKSSNIPWEGFATPALPKSIKAEPQPKRKRPTKFRLSDGALLPLTNLGRHLRPVAPNFRQREQVLEELRKSKSKFLTDTSSAIPLTPPSVVLSQPPLTPKRQKNKRHTFILPPDIPPLGTTRAAFR